MCPKTFDRNKKSFYSLCKPDVREINVYVIKDKEIKDIEETFKMARRSFGIRVLVYTVKYINK